MRLSIDLVATVCAPVTPSISGSTTTTCWPGGSFDKTPSTVLTTAWSNGTGAGGGLGAAGAAAGAAACVGACGAAAGAAAVPAAASFGAAAAGGVLTLDATGPCGAPVQATSVSARSSALFALL